MQVSQIFVCETRQKQSQKYLVSGSRGAPCQRGLKNRQREARSLVDF